jgi:hypothetical protein
MKTSTTRRTVMNTNSHHGVALASLAALLTGSACGPMMDPPSLVQDTRVIGARVEVSGAPDRAMPRPGEAIRVTWLVTAPRAVPAMGWAFAACAGQGGADPTCQGPPAVMFQGHGVPVVELTVPEAHELGSVRELVLYGRICPDGEPAVDPAGAQPGCAGGTEGTTAALAIPLALDRDEGNHNPSLAGQAATFDGQPWAVDERQACADLPQVTAGTADHVLGLETAGRDRERFTTMAGDPPVPTEQRERLQISQFTTAGKLERSFSEVESDDPGERPAIEVKWKAPAAADVPVEGLVVRFTFVARDLRGGVDWTSRAVCVTR